MPTDTALATELREAIAEIAHADLVVGIPSFRNAGTIGHVVASVRDGLRASFPDARAVIVNSDGGSDDGTRDVVRGYDSADVRVVTGRYAGPSGKGSALRAVCEAVLTLEARACAVLDSDLRSVTPLWVDRLLRPIVEDRADYVAPLYLRHKHDGTITNTVAYPLVRALYGYRVRQPIGGEFGFRDSLARRFLDEGAWDGAVARFGIDVFMTTTALASGARVVQAALGAKIHDPKDPARHLGPMFVQVLASLCERVRAHRQVWPNVTGSRDVPVEGELPSVEPEPVPVDMARLDDACRSASEPERRLWQAVLCDADRARFEQAAGASRAADRELERVWARLLYDVVAAVARDPARATELITALIPLYLARVAMHVRAAEGRSSREAEALVGSQAVAFETEKPHLVDRSA